MPLEDSTGERRQSNCPKCKGARGKPLKVTAVGNERTITYSCSDCGHRWDVGYHNEKMFRD